LIRMEAITLGEKYFSKAETYRIQAENENKTLLLLSAMRLLTFIGGIILIWICFNISKYYGLISVLGIISLFLYLLRSYSFHTSRKEYLVNLELINRNEEKAVSGDFSMFENGSSFASTTHDFSHDIDIFGPSSLFQYLNRTSTGYGGEVLAGWLSDPYILSTSLLSRQETITEIGPKLEWRQKFLATAMNKNLDREHISGLLKWLKEKPMINPSLKRKAFIWILPSITISSLLLLAAGLMSYYIFLSLFLATLFITFYNLRRTSAIHEELTGKYRFLSSFSSLLALLKSESFRSEAVNAMKKEIAGENRSAVTALKELSRIIRAFDSRLNILVGFFLNGLFLWDLHCIRRLEKWKYVNRDQFPLWLDMLGQVDALISLGNYTYNNPGFIYPRLADDGAPFRARKLGHQLIDPVNRVCNDFALSSRSRICIISGANMAGKSTFLRTVAVNFILAMVGAPVCAEEMHFTPVKLFTSMRTTDSLSTNESYFYAELKRLRSLEQKLLEGENLFFILDEILKGTNSEDKSQGSKLFIKRIIELGGTGLIATHDTTLGEMEKGHPGVIINKCVEVEIDGEKIIFDYLLRDGIASKRNAVLLMRQMGILG
jgi:DNA mismatch repair ATPase MutS